MIISAYAYLARGTHSSDSRWIWAGEIAAVAMKRWDNFPNTSPGAAREREMFRCRPLCQKPETGRCLERREAAMGRLLEREVGSVGEKLLSRARASLPTRTSLSLYPRSLVLSPISPRSLPAPVPSFCSRSGASVPHPQKRQRPSPLTRPPIVSSPLDPLLSLPLAPTARSLSLSSRSLPAPTPSSQSLISGASVPHLSPALPESRLRSISPNLSLSLSLPPSSPAPVPEPRLSFSLSARTGPGPSGTSALLLSPLPAHSELVGLLPQKLPLTRPLSSATSRETHLPPYRRPSRPSSPAPVPAPAPISPSLSSALVRLPRRQSLALLSLSLPLISSLVSLSSLSPSLVGSLSSPLVGGRPSSLVRHLSRPLASAVCRRPASAVPDAGPRHLSPSLSLTAVFPGAGAGPPSLSSRLSSVISLAHSRRLSIVDPRRSSLAPAPGPARLSLPPSLSPHLVSLSTVAPRLSSVISVALCRRLSVVAPRRSSPTPAPAISLPPSLSPHPLAHREWGLFGNSGSSSEALGC